jgi:hypothetical protein
MEKIIKILWFLIFCLSTLIGNDTAFKFNNQNERFHILTFYYNVATPDINKTLLIGGKDFNKNNFNVANYTLTTPLFPTISDLAQKLEKYHCKVEVHNHTYFFKKLRKKLDIYCVSKNNKNIISLTFFENIGLTYLEESSIESGKIIQKLKVELKKIKTENGMVSGSMLYEPDYIIIEQ